jgi:glycosyltransferase involved in cell wall biosynthesis
MVIHFFEPPAAQRTGGLDLAIRSLEDFLRRAGTTVLCNPTISELGKAGVRELVHFHGLWQPRFNRVSAHCRRAGIPYVISPHGMLEPWARREKRWKKRPWFLLFERRHLLGAARLLATSEIEAANLRRMFPSTTCVALTLGLAASHPPDYVSARMRLGWTDSEVVLLFLSRIHPKKGLDLLLSALSKLEQKTIDHVRLVIVGSGEPSYVRALQALVRRNRSRLPQVDWTPAIWGDGKWPYLQGADLFCLPSRSENFGLAVLEALQVGTRVLTTDKTPWAMLRSSGAGFIASPEIGDIASALKEFLAQPQWTAEQRTRLAKGIGERFSWETVGPSYLGFYADVVQQTNRAAI